MAFQLDELVSVPSRRRTGTMDATLLPAHDELRARIARLLNSDAVRYRRLWSYYRNPLLPCTAASPTGAESRTTSRPYRQAQEWGVPARITGWVAGQHPGDAFNSSGFPAGEPVPGVARKEVVIENDIGWRIDTLTDYLFGKPITIRSTARDPVRRAVIDELLQHILRQHGGVVFLQKLALLGAVYGFVDVLVKLDTSDAGGPPLPRSTDPANDNDSPSGAAPDAPDPSPAGPAPGFDNPLRRARSSDHDGRSDGENRSDDPPVTSDGPVDGADCDDDCSSASQRSTASLARVARCVRFEIVEPARALPLLSPIDDQSVLAYAQVYRAKRRAPVDGAGARADRAGARWYDRFLRNLRPATNGTSLHGDSGHVIVTEIIAPDRWQRYEDERLVACGANSLGEVPLVHIQNSAVPFEYSGTSDVEPLVPLQDELNTRLSDRAHRITMQSFKMYLGKGIENFGEMPVAPGRMWMTDNPDAQVLEFGGDSACPSEQGAITEVREAMDKTSSVTPIAAGAIKGRIGRLTSAAALRVTMLALLAKTERRRTSYGAGIQRMCELALAWLDRAGLFLSHPDERHVELTWPAPLPDSEVELLQLAKAKIDVGIDPATVRRELGY